MSSTNRGYERHKTDYYVTPQKEIALFLYQCQEHLPELFKAKYIHDPCAGGDAKNEMSYPAILSKFTSAMITTSDIREDSLAQEKGVDFLETKFKADVFITNPPFYLAQEIIEKAITDVDDNGLVIMLLRLNFWGSKKRAKWLKENMPYACFIHSKRMSFTEDGKTDSVEYAHFVWRKGEDPKYTKTYLISWMVYHNAEAMCYEAMQKAITNTY